ncbi:MAG: flagellar hook-length control protein [Proteobacteria bacterium]|nr:flagellar hook-length control protein [Pseudomonadota bacterium]
MAEVNAPTFAATAPVVQNNAPSQGASQSAGQTDQPSFAQVLKSRSQTQQNQKSDTGKAANASKAQDGQAGNAAQSTDTTAAASSDAAAQSVEKAMDPAVLLGLTGLNPEKSTSITDTTKSTDDSTTVTDEETQDGQTLLAASTAALAVQTAKLAGTQQTADKSTTDLATSSQQLREQSAPKNAASELLASDATTGKLTETQVQDKSLSFAAELANASQNLNVNAGAQATHGMLQNSHNQNALPQHEVTTPVASQGWAEEVGQKVSWIANRDSGRAELILTPPQLGRVEVSISMTGDQASATFVTASPAAREALQDAMPRLREVLAQSGIQLGQANVNAGFSGQTQSDNPGKPGTAGRFSAQSDGDVGGIDVLAGLSRSSWSRQGNGMIDTFA